MNCNIFQEFYRHDLSTEDLSSSAIKKNRKKRSVYDLISLCCTADTPLLRVPPGPYYTVAHYFSFVINNAKLHQYNIQFHFIPPGEMKVLPCLQLQNK